MTRPIMLPVHCCCDPTTRLGWVPVDPRQQHAGAHVRFVLTPARWTLERGTQALAVTLDTVVEELSIPTPIAEVIAAPLDHALTLYPFAHILAVKSNHHPIETWRKVPGFVDESTMQSFRQAILAAAQTTEGGKHGEEEVEAKEAQDA